MDQQRLVRVCPSSINLYGHRFKLWCLSTPLRSRPLSTNVTVFVAGCLHHIYLMPISPRLRSSTSPNAETQFTHNISLADNLITILTTATPSRYQSISFHGPLSTSATHQYSSSLTLAEMVAIWYSPQSRGEVAGSLCSSHLQCDDVCYDESITSPQAIYSNDSYVFNCLILGGFLLFVSVILITAIGLLADALHWAAYITTQIQPIDEGNHSESLFLLSLSLSEAITIEREKFFVKEMRDYGPGEEGVCYRSLGDMYDVEAVREVLYEKYGKKAFIKHMAASESNENNK